jgi:myo-inositol-1(or 4)-monophosphatase
MNYVKLLESINELVVKEGEFLQKALLSNDALNFHLKSNKNKNWSDLDLNTELDEKIEMDIYNKLSKEFPELGFLLEEHEELNNKGKEFTCFIDPIDGSKYFAKKVPFFAISVGVLKGDVPVLGVIYNPISNQLYSAAEGIPTTLNGVEVKVSEETNPQSAMISVDLASHKENWDSEKVWMNEKLAQLINNFGKVRLFGNGALSCAWSATGGLDAFVSLWGHGSKPFDIMAGKALIKYAGGKTIDLRIPGIKQPRFIGGNEVLVEEISRILLT